MGSGKLIHVRLEGAPEEIGYQHGRLLRSRVHQCFAFYRDFINMPDSDLEHRGAHYLDFTERHFPKYFREINGLAEGAGLRPWQIAVLNARTEIFLEANVARINECTSLCFPGSRYIGQNWDWMSPCESLIVLLEIQHEDGHRVLTMTEPGILGKVGLNAKGLGVCLNILVGEDAPVGAPIHLLLRRILDCKSMAEAIEFLDKVPKGSFSNILIADEHGNYLDLEFNGSEMIRVSYDQEPIVHTNHYLSRQEQENQHILNSRVRLDRAREVWRESGGCTLDDMKRILGDKANGEDAICKKQSPFLDTEMGTICSLMIDLCNRAMYITEGSPFHSDFKEFRL